MRPAPRGTGLIKEQQCGLLELDRLVRAHIGAGPTLSAVIGTSQNGYILKIESACGALIDTDAAGSTQIRIDDRLTHITWSFQRTGDSPKTGAPMIPPGTTSGSSHFVHDLLRAP